MLLHCWVFFTIYNIIIFSNINNMIFIKWSYFTNLASLQGEALRRSWPRDLVWRHRKASTLRVSCRSHLSSPLLCSHLSQGLFTARPACRRLDQWMLHASDLTWTNLIACTHSHAMSGMKRCCWRYTIRRVCSSIPVLGTRSSPLIGVCQGKTL